MSKRNRERRQRHREAGPNRRVRLVGESVAVEELRPLIFDRRHWTLCQLETPLGAVVRLNLFAQVVRAGWKVVGIPMPEIGRALVLSVFPKAEAKPLHLAEILGDDVLRLEEELAAGKDIVLQVEATHQLAVARLLTGLFGARS